MQFLITNCYFTIGNLVFKQKIGFPMDIDLASYWETFFVFFFQSKFVWKLISKGSPRSYKFHGTSTFIDDLCLMIDDGDFSSSYEYIYWKQFKLKLKKQDEHAIFLHLDIKN